MEFMGRESVAYLRYLYCRAEWLSMKDWNLTKFQSCGMSKEWRKMDSHLEREFGLLFELLFCKSLGEWDFLLSFSMLFLRE